MPPLIVCNFSNRDRINWLVYDELRYCCSHSDLNGDRNLTTETPFRQYKICFYVPSVTNMNATYSVVLPLFVRPSHFGYVLGLGPYLAKYTWCSNDTSPVL